jgi:hypothetical protein
MSFKLERMSQAATKMRLEDLLDIKPTCFLEISIPHQLIEFGECILTCADKSVALELVTKDSGLLFKASAKDTGSAKLVVEL